MSFALVLVVVMAAAALAVLMKATAGRRAFVRPRRRSDPAAAVQRIEAAYEAAHDAMLRRTLVLEAVALKDAAILRFLADVANAPRNSARESERAAEESALRLIAVDGIGALSRQGDVNAAALLRQLVASADPAVQAAAMVALRL